MRLTLMILMSIGIGALNNYFNGQWPTVVEFCIMGWLMEIQYRVVTT